MFDALLLFKQILFARKKKLSNFLTRRCFINYVFENDLLVGELEIIFLE